MITEDGPKVLEYNCRLGDPETQPLIMRLRSDLVELCEATLDGRLNEIEADWDSRPALGVVMAAAGYPGPYRKGDAIEGRIARAMRSKACRINPASQRELSFFTQEPAI